MYTAFCERFSATVKMNAFSPWTLMWCLLKRWSFSWICGRLTLLKFIVGLCWLMFYFRKRWSVQCPRPHRVGSTPASLLPKFSGVVGRLSCAVEESSAARRRGMAASPRERACRCDVLAPFAGWTLLPRRVASQGVVRGAGKRALRTVLQQSRALASSRRTGCLSVLSTCCSVFWPSSLSDCLETEWVGVIYIAYVDGCLEYSKSKW